MVFTDILVLLPNSPTRIHHLIDHTASYLKNYGLMLNNISHTVATFEDGYRRKTVVDARASSIIQGDPVS